MEPLRPVILCVDSDGADLQRLGAVLRARFGRTHEVTPVTSAAEALEVFRRVREAGGEAQLVVCRQGLPDLPGPQLLEKIHAAHPEVRKLLLVERGSMAALLHALNHGGLHRAIELPCDPEALARMAEGLLAEFHSERELEIEHQRLVRRSRELHSLIRLGRGLSGVSEPDRVLGLVAVAARGLSRAHRAEVVAQVDTHDRPWWSSAAAPPFTVELRRAVEAQLGERRAGPPPGLPTGLPPGTLSVPIEHAGTLFGWLFLVDAPRLSPDTRDLLEVLAGQAAVTLHNLELIQEAVRTERLSAIGRMLSSIVHDFRNPMTSIRGYAAIIEEMDIGRERRQRYAHLVVEETDRMSAMIDELLEFTRGGPKHLKRRTVTVEELAARLQRVLEPDLVARGVSFAADLDYRGPVSVDVDRLLRALLNIAGNALDAMEAGGTLRVGARLGAEGVELDLADTGRGIPEELQGRIYEPFFTHGKPRGIGLGMSITRRIVEDHGGSIRLRSAVGQGTCFTVVLPAAEVGAGAGAAAPWGPAGLP